MAQGKSRFLLSATVVAVALVAGWAYMRRTVGRAQAAANRYVDSSLCEQCHADIARTYHKTGMARSFYRLTPDTAVENFTAKPFYQAASGSYFAMIARGGKYYQRRWQIGPDGKDVNIDEKQVDFVIGSGNHARTYLHLTSRNTLQVLPLSWYSEKGGYWAMSPGYDHPDFPGSIRPVHYECMYCHNAYPKIPPSDGAEMTFLQPIPQGIDCQRCHGPGQKHVERASEGASVDQIRAAIVNPKRLSPEREMEVCLQCHLETTSRSLPHAIRRLDRGPFSYIPGEPLGDFRVDFDSAPGTNQGFEIVHAAYRLMESQCFLKSGGQNGKDQLRCTTCHDPHDIPRGKQAEAHYNSVCLKCHGAVLGPAKSPAMAALHKRGADCVSCHMPKRRTDDVVHVVMTDHLIQRRKPAGDLLADKTEKPESPYRGEVFPYYPRPLPARPENSLITAIAQVRDGSNLKEGVPRLAALVNQLHPSDAGYYADLAQGYRFSGDAAQAAHYYQMAAQRDPSSYRLTQLGNALMENRQWPDAEAALRRATALDPGDPVAWGTLGWVLWQEDKGADARAPLEKGVALDPELPELHNNLGSVLWGMSDQDAALKEFREALRIQPGVAEWRLNLARMLASRGDLVEARYQFEESVRLKPDLAQAHVDYARLLASLNQLAEAEKQLAEAVKADPGSAPAHELRGSILTARGNLDEGIRELESAIRLQPNFWRAHFELAMALGRKGDSAGAIEHLKIAASGNDPEASAAARQVLAKIGQ